MKRLPAYLLSAVLALGLLCGCGASSDAGQDTSERIIKLTGTSAESKAGGVSISRGTVTLSAPGSYRVSGTLDNGRIIVDTGEDPGKVELILDNASVTCPDGPALWVAQAKKLNLVIADGSSNTLCSGSADSPSAQDESTAGGAVYAEDDIDIEDENGGTGSLDILGYLNSGIVGKDDVEIKCGRCVLNIRAVNNGIKGSESVVIKSGNISVDAVNDGIKATSVKKEGKGFAELSGGVISVKAGGDGISAETVLTVSGGVLDIETAGNPELGSCKALKAKTGVVVSGGAISLLSSDHAIHCGESVELLDGTIDIKSSAKGISAHGPITVSGGALALESTDDGVESEVSVSISGGTLSIISEGNGIKAGAKNTGIGSVLLSGGSVEISAGKDSVYVQDCFSVSGGSLFALGTAKRQRELSGSVPCAAVQLSGSAGTAVKIGSSSLEARYPFELVLYSGEAISGGKLTVSAGGRTETVTVQ